MKHYNYIFTGAGLSALMTVIKWRYPENLRTKRFSMLMSLKKRMRTLVFLKEQDSIWEKSISKNEFGAFANADFREI
jgi:lycopene beta-cyclase